jgi:hypothetical protein
VNPFSDPDLRFLITKNVKLHTWKKNIWSKIFFCNSCACIFCLSRSGSGIRSGSETLGTGTGAVLEEPTCWALDVYSTLLACTECSGSRNRRRIFSRTSCGNLIRKNSSRLWHILLKFAWAGTLDLNTYIQLDNSKLNFILVFSWEPFQKHQQQQHYGESEQSTLPLPQGVPSTRLWGHHKSKDHRTVYARAFNQWNWQRNTKFPCSNMIRFP